MPTTIAEMFAALRLRQQGVVKWGAKPKEHSSGVYIVSLTESLDALDGKLMDAPLAAAQFKQWLGVCPKLTLDGVKPTSKQLMDRVRRFWIPDEVILYIGLATDSLRTRLGAYYRTPIGERSPHSGGYFLKLLSNLDQLWVHYSQCPDPSVAEDKMLRHFCKNVSDNSKRVLFDPAHPFPFANLEWPKPVRKAHGIKGARKPR